MFIRDDDEVIVISRSPGSSGGSSGGGSGGGSASPKNPGDVFTEAERKRLKECWEEKVKAIAILKGWDEIERTGATTGATWEFSEDEQSSFGKTVGTVEDESVSIITTLFPKRIGLQMLFVLVMR